MKATELLKKQHKEVRDLFKRIESEERGDAKTELFEELATKLVGHDSIERKIFYPACEEHLGMSDNLGEALVEHGVVEFSLHQADQAQNKGDFGFKCKVLQDVLEHHISEEESELFPKVESELGKDALEELGAEMLDAFEIAKNGDFRVPLHQNLKQVLAGSLKPASRRPSKKSNKKSQIRAGKNV